MNIINQFLYIRWYNINKNKNNCMPNKHKNSKPILNKKKINIAYQ